MKIEVGYINDMTNMNRVNVGSNTKRAVRKAMEKMHPVPCCHYCTKALDWNSVYSHTSSREDIHEARKTCVTLDHIIPAIKGGKHRPSNMVIACQECNETRGHMAYWMFKFLRKMVGIKVMIFLKKNSFRNIMKHRFLKIKHTPKRNIIRDYAV